MYRLVWCLLVSLFAIAVQVSSDTNLDISTTQSSVQELRQDEQEQQVSIVENYEYINQIRSLFRNIEQEMQQKRAQSQKAIADNHAKQEQSIHLLLEIQKEIQNHQKEIEKDRVQVAKWQSEITTNQIETVNVLKEVLRDIATIQVTQNQTIEPPNNLQQEAQQEQKDETKFEESREVIKDVNEQQNVRLLINLPQTLAELKTEMSKQREQCIDNHNKYETRIEQLERENEKLRSTLLDVQLSSYWTCKDVPIKVSGKYNIHGNDTFSSFVAYCEQEKHGGGWMVIQHRFDGSLSFDRNWTAYRNGFGEINGEHWLGLERIHQFTKEHDCELLVEMKDFYNNSKYAKYSSFRIGNESQKYGLLTLGEYSGTAGDSLSGHVRIMFSTPDRDNDFDSENHCAEYYQGGWWFYKCFYVFLNGLYDNATGSSVSRIAWDDFDTDQRSLSYSRMLIRPLN
uniref:Putative ficolin n=1 Tax=Anopheles darlingi TaxID=43151 RepID=A0A2M4DAW0_ANODA